MPAPLHSLPPPSKKRKIQPSVGHADSIQHLEVKLTTAVAKNESLNPLIDLLKLTHDIEDPHDTSKAIYALYRVFVTIISNGKLEPRGDAAAKVVKSWIWERLQTYVDYLGGLLQDDEKFLRVSTTSYMREIPYLTQFEQTAALQIMFSLLKHLSSSYSVSLSQPQFHNSHFRKIVTSLLTCPHSRRKSSAPKSGGGLLAPDVMELFHENWFGLHDDIRWFFLRESA